MEYPVLSRIESSLLRSDDTFGDSIDDAVAGQLEVPSYFCFIAMAA